MLNIPPPPDGAEAGAPDDPPPQLTDDPIPPPDGGNCCPWGAAEGVAPNTKGAEGAVKLLCGADDAPKVGADDKLFVLPPDEFNPDGAPKDDAPAPPNVKPDGAPKLGTEPVPE